MDYYCLGSYCFNEIVQQYECICEVVEQLVYLGLFCCWEGEFWDIYDLLLVYGDEYFVLCDFVVYVDVYVVIDKVYCDVFGWLYKVILNIV